MAPLGLPAYEHQDEIQFGACSPMPLIQCKVLSQKIASFFRRDAITSSSRLLARKFLAVLES
jgi:hypothetical protein